ncbi:alpha-N-arabinofuranosidase [Henriciella mobilis]|uniref:non-reducing end alpha-L-arabinofuranosidase n=1 Tax=Henriciella mobilis TaxID=2305467 RepID=A0A399RT97_9PROT|nr:alpha-L-arabinofuranosidase C-terminal domain-containing protein [Henriciella mobilis]RIJ32705.1 alpha-N-arabinofuranosidase [Henriciella mobilis]
MIRSALLAASMIALSACATIEAQTRATVDPSSPIGTIAPEVYGQFLEHLGAQPYGSIWVGEDSDIPNTDGIRDDVFAALDKLDIPVIRWPGGCYSDRYYWRDGIGERALRTNAAWGGTLEPNTFGTHEFFNLAERLGAKTYLNINIGTGTPKDAADWLEYITATRGDRAEERRSNGRDEPWTVDYLAIGNETWGCGGHITPEYYADTYALYSSFAKTEGEQPKRIISGSHDENIEYSDAVLSHPYIADLAEGISVHVYSLPTGDWGAKGAAVGFPEAEWISTLSRALRMEGVITDQIAMFEEHEDLGDDFGLYVDEWGTWYDPATEDTPALYQQNTMRDAVVAALSLNIFHDHADRVAMTNIAQMVNVLQAMILTDGPDMVLTPTYHVFEMYKPFQGATALPVSYDAPDYSHGDYTIPAISLSAAKTPDGKLVVALINSDAKAAHAVDISAFGASAFTGRILTADAMDAHNTFEAPEAVTPSPFEVEGGVANLPPHSVVVLTEEQ